MTTLPPTSAIADVVAMHGVPGCLTPPLRVVAHPGRAVLGAAITVLVTPGHGEQGLDRLYDLLSEPLHGGVLVIAGAGAIEGSVFGQILARAAHQVGVVAAVIDGGVRDVATLAGEAMPVAALREHTAGAAGLGHVVATRCDVVIGGATISDGDWIVLDEGGAVRLPALTAETLIADAAGLAAAEERVLADLAAGARLNSAYLHKRTAVDHIRGTTPSPAVDRGGALSSPVPTTTTTIRRGTAPEAHKEA